MSAFLVSAANPLIRPLIYLSVAAGIFCTGFWQGCQWKGDEEANKSLAAEYKAERVRRATEDAWQLAHWKLAYAAEESRVERERQYQTDVDSLRAGTLRVRPRLTCPKAPAAPGVVAEPDHQESGLLPEDAEFLLSLAREADVIADERNQCIASYEALRAKP